MSDSGEIQPGEAITIMVNGASLVAHRGQTIGAALLAHGIRTLRHTRRDGKPRGLFCSMGVCFDCIVMVDGRPGLRACMTRVEPRMNVTLPKKFSGLASR